MIKAISHGRLMQTLRHQLIVSCQAEPNEPLGKPAFLAAMAQAAVKGGAKGIRACQPHNIRAIRSVVDVPVIGISKKHFRSSPVYITPTLSEAERIARSGASIIAMDATARPRPGKLSLKQIVQRLLTDWQIALMADVSTLDEGLRAAELGFNLIGTTLSGYTESSPAGDPYLPDVRLVERLVHHLNGAVPVIAEGRIWEPHQVQMMFEAGAYAVVIGSAITRPWLITERFIRALPPR